MKHKHFIYIYFLFGLILSNFVQAKQREEFQNYILSTHRIDLEQYPHAFNPSIVKTKEGFLLTFRHCLGPEDPWVSYIGIVALDKNLAPISKPQLLDTRMGNRRIPPHSEDARIFVYNQEIYLVYNDNNQLKNLTSNDRRDMFVAKLIYNDRENFYTVSTPLKLRHEQKYGERRVQKNWTPFQWDDKLLFIYTGNPHEIIYPNLDGGVSQKLYATPFLGDWRWGDIRGGTPAVLVDGEYLTFFHSMRVASSKASNGVPMFHYYMGAYTFSNQPPFEIKKISPSPIMGKGFYTPSNLDKRVIFPGGFAVKGQYIYVAYGKDDHELWVAIIDKAKLLASLLPCQGLR